MFLGQLQVSYFFGQQMVTFFSSQVRFSVFVQFSRFQFQFLYFSSSSRIQFQFSLYYVSFQIGFFYLGFVVIMVSFIDQGYLGNFEQSVMFLQLNIFNRNALFSELFLVGDIIGDILEKFVEGLQYCESIIFFFFYVFGFFVLKFRYLGFFYFQMELLFLSYGRVD